MPGFYATDGIQVRDTDSIGNADEGRAELEPANTAPGCQTQVSGSKAQWRDILHLGGETLHQKAEKQSH